MHQSKADIDTRLAWIGYKVYKARYPGKAEAVGEMKESKEEEDLLEFAIKPRDPAVTKK